MSITEIPVHAALWERMRQYENEYDDGDGRDGDDALLFCHPAAMGGVFSIYGLRRRVVSVRRSAVEEEGG